METKTFDITSINGLDGTITIGNIYKDLDNIKVYVNELKLGDELIKKHELATFSYIGGFECSKILLFKDKKQLLLSPLSCKELLNYIETFKD